MKQFVLVGLGGALGSMLRFQTVSLATRFSPQFPGGTVAVNLLGCFLIGLLSALAQKRGVVSEEARLLLVTGFLGGFTTFSAFGLDTLKLMQSSKYLPALGNILLSVLGGLAMVWMGWLAVGAASK